MKKVLLFALGCLIALGVQAKVYNLADFGAGITWTATANDTIKGKLAHSSTKIRIQEGVMLTFMGVEITPVAGETNRSPVIECLGNAVINLASGSVNTLKASDIFAPAIYVPEKKTLTICGSGTLNAYARGDAAAIGAGAGKPCGNIKIIGGHINAISETIKVNAGIATAYEGSAGIGASCDGSCGNITIKGGYVNAAGGFGAAGIGGGGYCYDYAGGMNGGCGNISISGQCTVIAQGGSLAPGIGSGIDNRCESVVIDRGVFKLRAFAGEDWNQCVGVAENGEIGAISINDELVNPTSTAVLCPFKLPENAVYTPSDVRVYDISNTEASVNWEPGDEETEWRIKYHQHNNPGVGYNEYNTKNRPTRLHNLLPSTSYDVYVKAIGIFSNSDWTRAYTFTTKEEANPCATPTDLKVTDVTDNSVTLTWKSGDPNTQRNYEVRYSDNDAAFFVKDVENTTTCTLTGLQPETEYRVWLAGYCANGVNRWSEETDAVYFTTTDTPCPEPDEWKDGGNWDWDYEHLPTANIRVTWDKTLWTEVTVGCRKQISDEEWRTVTLPGSVGSYTFTDLEWSVKVPSKTNIYGYEYKWTAYDISLTGHCGSKITETQFFMGAATGLDPTPPAPACDAPTNLKVDAVSYSSVSLSWTPGSDEQTDFTVQILNKADQTIETQSLTHTNSFTYDFLRESTEYEAQVYGYCDHEQTEWSKKVTFTTPRDPRTKVYTSYKNGVITYYCDALMGTHTGAIDEEYYNSSDRFASYYSQVTRAVIDPSMKDTAMKSMEYLFGNASNHPLYIQYIDGMENLNTSKLENTYRMFYYCNKLIEVDLTHFDMSKVTNAEGMFGECSNLTTIYCDDDWSQYPNLNGYLFLRCSKLTGKYGTTVSSAGKGDKTYARPDEPNRKGLFTSALAVYTSYNSDTKTLTYYYDSRFGKEDRPNSEAYEPTGDRWSEYYYDVEHVVVDESMKYAQLTSMQYMFSNLSNCLSYVTTISGMENLNTDQVTDMSNMFYKCESLASVDLTHFNTANVTDMSYMFYKCKALKTVDLSSFDISKLDNTKNMFFQCSALETIYGSSDWNQGPAMSSTEGMFIHCRALVGGKGTAYDAEWINKTYARPDGGKGSSTPGYFATPQQVQAAKEDLLEKSVAAQFIGGALKNAGQSAIANQIDEAVKEAMGIYNDDDATTADIFKQIEKFEQAVNNYSDLLLEGLKSSRKDELQGLIKPEDSDACKQIVNDAVDDIMDQNWYDDPSIITKLNKTTEALDDIVERAKRDLNDQRTRELTGIEAIRLEEGAKPAKILYNGQLYILRGDMIFNASGMRVR